MNPFNNPQIAVESLPEHEVLEFTSLESPYRSVLVLRSLIFWGIVGAIFSGIALLGDIYFLEKNKLIIGAILAAIFLLSLLNSIVGFYYKAYALRHHDIHYKTGWFWRSTTVIPFIRIQHSEVVQGPLERMFGLGRLRVFTAGGSTSDLSIPGLKHKTANQLKLMITNRVNADEEE